jgi:hypothetical protein
MRVQILNNGLSTPTSTNTELLISDMIPTQLPFAINFNFQPIETIFTTPIYIQGTYRFERTNLPSNFISSTAYLLIFEFFEKK